MTSTGTRCAKCGTVLQGIVCIKCTGPGASHERRRKKARRDVGGHYLKYYRDRGESV